ncbi:hypothetical protein ACM44_14095 [Chryseobacterium koreense CCUG 49689]|uniref:Uncharacterized protein n=1 Tax=Chryseobacterium koreense CCUG 49689 TaxID=1304281 RepID=A0A0J7IWD9_9FLAO|nr:hypothetical protein ACM44_14095 [Chryseobacterium koreense CCUG 49689]
MELKGSADLTKKKNETARSNFSTLISKSVPEAKTEVKTLTDDSATEFAKIRTQDHQFFFVQKLTLLSYFSKLNPVFFKAYYHIFQILYPYFSKFVVIFFKF